MYNFNKSINCYLTFSHIRAYSSDEMNRYIFMARNDQYQVIVINSKKLLGKFHLKVKYNINIILIFFYLTNKLNFHFSI